jgi:hypothetical protein
MNVVAGHGGWKRVVLKGSGENFLITVLLVVYLLKYICDKVCNYIQFGVLCSVLYENIAISSKTDTIWSGCKLHVTYNQQVAWLRSHLHTGGKNNIHSKPKEHILIQIAFFFLLNLVWFILLCGEGGRWRCGYSYSPQAVGFGIRSPFRPRNYPLSTPVQTGPGAHTTSTDPLLMSKLTL